MKKNKVQVVIDGVKIEAEKRVTILEAAERAKINIPRLCFLKDTSPYGACRICLVEIEGENRPAPACMRQVEEGMVVRTNTPLLRRIRKKIVELLLSEHIQDCPICKKSDSCELLSLSYQLGVEEVTLPVGTGKDKPKDETGPSLVRDANKCILCGRCTRVCDEIQSVNVIDLVGRGKEMRVAAFWEKGLGKVYCSHCGQCLAACPVNAIMERSSVEEVWDALYDEDKYVVVQIAPSIRVSLGEEFGFLPGELTIKKIYAALKRLGFNAVFDTNFSADLTIVEEAFELVERIKNKKALPQLTSCCPAWIKFMEDFYFDLSPYVSTCKSPQQMMGALVKTYYAQESKIDPQKIVSVSIMPCTAKKFEAEREEMDASHFKDVDYVLTTKEIVRMFKEAGIDFRNIEEKEPDSILGMYTGAGTIFGASGGVMEAALRTAYYYVTGEELENIEFKKLRGLKGIKEAELKIKDLNIKVAVAHGLSNTRVLLEQIRKGNSPYTFIEIMACPGGCVGGGGQPAGFNLEIRKKRAQGLYREDKKLTYRRSHQNPMIKLLYDKFLKNIGGELSHKLLHTHYRKREYNFI